MQSLQASNEKLAERIHTMEIDSLNLTEKNHSMSMGHESLLQGTEKLSERIHAVKIDNQNLLKCCDKSTDRTYLQENNLNTIQIISKGEN